MKCLAARIDWHKGFCNNPTLVVFVDRIPDRSELRFERRGDIWYGEKDGWVSFYEWKPPHRQEGYGGSTFSITMKDESKVDLLGPWSVAESYAHTAGFPHCLPITITTDPKVMVEGHTFLGGHVTREWAEKVVAEFLPGMEIRQSGSELHGTPAPDNAMRPFFENTKPLCFYPAVIGEDVAVSKAAAPFFLGMQRDYWSEQYFDVISNSAVARGYDLAQIVRFIPFEHGHSHCPGRLHGCYGAVKNGRVIMVAEVRRTGGKTRLNWVKRKSANYTVYSEASHWVPADFKPAPKREKKPRHARKNRRSGEIIDYLF